MAAPPRSIKGVKLLQTPLKPRLLVAVATITPIYNKILFHLPLPFVITEYFCSSLWRGVYGVELTLQKYVVLPQLCRLLLEPGIMFSHINIANH